MSLSQEQQNKILRLIDRGEWKHSWHLPRNSWGSIDWWNPKTAEDCLKVLVAMKAECEQVIRMINEVDVACANHLESVNQRLREEAEDDLNASCNGPQRE